MPQNTLSLVVRFDNSKTPDLSRIDFHLPFVDSFELGLLALPVKKKTSGYDLDEGPARIAAYILTLNGDPFITMMLAEDGTYNIHELNLRNPVIFDRFLDPPTEWTRDDLEARFRIVDKAIRETIVPLPMRNRMLSSQRA